MSPDAELLIAKLKALADPVRLRIVALCLRGECSVSELTEVLAQSQPRVSQQVKILCDSKLLLRFRDGHFVYYRVPVRGTDGAVLRRLLGLFDENDVAFQRDLERLRKLRGTSSPIKVSDDDRALHRALVELTVATPLGDLIDIGCGQGRILKLLASRAQRAVGVDIDANARRFARAEVLLAGLPNCTLRQGDMYTLPFADGEFDTVILDDVLGDAEHPLQALTEARRLLKTNGRLLLLATTSNEIAKDLQKKFGSWCRDANLRLTTPRVIPANKPRWLLAVATLADSATAAA
jgi:ArsR family transcriptional regulator